ncbi:hypothetical protein C8Q74DRAFT_1319353 [Fomes fomentarius]|nr:hypothetical protein C8Q74DRAFT_1319353 [Fomes fomentarius]
MQFTAKFTALACGVLVALTSAVTASPTSESLVDCERDEEFWFDDGNIVLIAGNLSFKVYRGLLASQSPVFADMFSTGDPHADSQIDGCPIVHLQDTPQALRHLLRALIPSRERRVFKLPTKGDYSFDQISALIRLGHKYQIEDVQHQALAVLQTAFPSTFKEFSNRDASSLFGPPPVRRKSSGIEAIHLAQLTETPALLPTAFYSCTILGEAVVDGHHREDGTVQYLSVEDLRRFIRGYGEVKLRVPHSIARIFELKPDKQCTSPNTCCVAFHTIQAEAGGIILRRWLGAIDRWGERPGSYCKACAKMLKARVLEEQKDLWRDLPAIFDVEVEGWGADLT